MTPPANLTRGVSPWLFVAGEPVPQGSVDARMIAGRPQVTHQHGPELRKWRDVIRGAVDSSLPATVRQWRTGYLYEPRVAVRLGLEFIRHRPVSTPKTFTPPWSTRSDLDKLVRAVLDALTGWLYADDAQVCGFYWCEKRTAEIGEAPGLWLSWAALDRHGEPLPAFADPQPEGLFQ